MSNPIRVTGATGDRTLKILVALYEHRALTVAQLMTLLEAPNKGVLSILEKQRRFGLVERGWLPKVIPRISVWYLTEKGLRLVAQSGLVEPNTRREVPPSIAGGVLSIHHQQINDVGISFLEAAREREENPPHWGHEIRHNGSGWGPTRQTHIVPDALIHFEVHKPGANPVLHLRFCELDRSTMSVPRLVNRLLGYSRLRAHREAWDRTYPYFPPVLVIFTGGTRTALEARMATVAGALRNDPRATDVVPMLFCLLEDLIGSGPFAPIFQRPLSPAGPGLVNVLGQGGTDTLEQAG